MQATCDRNIRARRIARRITQKVHYRPHQVIRRTNALERRCIEHQIRNLRVVVPYKFGLLGVNEARRYRVDPDPERR